MRKSRGLLRALLIALAVSATALSGSSTVAEEPLLDTAERLLVRESELTSELRALSKAMSKELAQVAVGAHAESAIGDLGRQRRRFAGLLQELQGLEQARPIANPEIELHMASAQDAWPELDRMIGDALSWGHLTHHEFQGSQTAARRLDLALGDLQGAYRRAAVDLGVHSVMLNAIAVAEEQRILSQEIPRAFILMLNGINNSENRERLRSAIGEFDRDMLGLLEGSPERGLVAAPTASIRADLEAAQATWIELQDALRMESSGVALDALAIGRVSDLSDTLYQQLDTAISDLRAL